MSLRTITACFITLVLSWAAAPAAAQDVPSVDASELRGLCDRGLCRRDITTQVRLPNGQVQEERITEHRPAILRPSVSVMLGEQLEAVADFDDGKFVGWRAPERRESSRNIVLNLKLEQTESDGSVSVELRNNGRQPVKLNLFVRTAGSAQGEYTSSCPIIAGGTAYEYWSRPIVELIVGEAILVSDDGALQCN